MGVCKRGHVGSPRRTNGTCVACDNGRVRTPEHKAKCLARIKQWKAENPDKAQAAIKAWVDRNRDRMHYLSRRWREENRAKARANSRARQTRKLRALPVWANRFFIEEFYDLARLREKHLGGKWHVDHIVPLKHPLVCGLHVEYNLRVITAEENLRKSNNFEGGITWQPTQNQLQDNPPAVCTPSLTL